MRPAAVRAGLRLIRLGSRLIPATGAIGTLAADDSVADNLPGEADFGFVGSIRSCMSIRVGGDDQMGVRQYVAALGRFLAT
jgi:hypothetical protein